MSDLSESLDNALKNMAPGSANGQAGSAQDAESISYEDLRSSPRKQFQCKQRIAPMHSDFLPQTDEYFSVECFDISQGGISFYLKRPPGCERFVITLGQKPAITLLIGRVVYSREVQHNGERMYLVGCQFINRLNE